MTNDKTDQILAHNAG